MGTPKTQLRWIEGLDEEDLALIKRLVLGSGSLKALAKEYGVSYPTIRLRLDQLIEKIQLLDAAEGASRFEQMVVALYADRKVNAKTMNALLDAHQREMETLAGTSRGKGKR